MGRGEQAGEAGAHWLLTHLGLPVAPKMHRMGQELFPGSCLYLLPLLGPDGWVGFQGQGCDQRARIPGPQRFL